MNQPLPKTNDFDLPSRARQILNTVFGYHDFRGQQEEIITHVAGSGNALVLMPTGAGKSLCYQIPALMQGGTGIVISPLIALMQDQVDALAQLGIQAAFLNSTLDPAAARTVEQRLRTGEIGLLYVAPERLVTERFLDLLDSCRINLFAIDEAHCVSQWGHDFRPEYTRLSVLHTRYPDVPRIALTATADELTRAEILAQLRLEDARVFISGFDRPNIRYRVAEKINGPRQLLDFLREEEREGQAGIIYCGSRRKTEETAGMLNEKGFTALAYHAGMDNTVRQKNQQRFLREDGIIMVATVAFGMGIDKPNVRFVAHLDLPQSLEAYYQETGRAGRDGEASEAWMAYGLGDAAFLRQRIDQSELPEAQKSVQQKKLGAMLGFCETARCRRMVLLNYFGETHHTPCGNCDVCLDPPQTWDASVAVQKILSAALRTGQRFGAGYLISLLLGRADERMEQNTHDRLPTFGAGKEHSETTWRSVIRQMIAEEFFNVSPHGALEMTEKARPVLKGTQTVSFRTVTERKLRNRRRDKTATANDTLTPAADELLLQALRDCRRSLAAAQGVPAYVIFHDTTLKEIAAHKPATPEALRGISGVGETKLARYGAAFLEIVISHKTSAGDFGDFSPTVQTTIAMFRKGAAHETIATTRGLKISTIYAHLAEAIAAGELALTDAVRLSLEQLAEIGQAFDDTRPASNEKLTPVFEKLNGLYDYGILRCVQAARGRP
jgi:ATP-dependent DNA helicase RecQ